MNKALWKDNLREIRHSFPRFLSILAIVALGVSFFVGIRASGPSMVSTAQKVYEDQNMPDGYILSTFGLVDEDLQAMESIEGVRWHPMRAIRANIEPGGESVKLYTTRGDDATDFYEVIDGREVSQAGEIVLDSLYLEAINDSAEVPIQIGDQIQVAYENPEDENGIHLDVKSFEVVGFAQNPLYMERTRRGTDYNAFGIIHEDSLSGDIYSEAYYWLEDAQGLMAYSPEYDAVVSEFETKLDDMALLREEERWAEIQDTIDEEIYEGRQELNDGYQGLAAGQANLRQVESDIQSGQETLDSGQRELAEGIEALGQGRQELIDGMASYQSGRLSLLDGRMQMADGQYLYESGYSDYEEGLALFESEIANARDQLNQGQAEVDLGYSQAQAGLNQLIAGQTAIEEGYAQLAAGRQELLDQINLATNGLIPAEDLLAALSGQIDTIESFIAILNNSDLDSEQIRNWIASLNVEQGQLEGYLEQLTAANDNIQVPLESVLLSTILTTQEITELESILGLEFGKSSTVSDALVELNSTIAGYETRRDEILALLADDTEIDSVDLTDSEITELETEIRQTIDTIMNLEGQVGLLQSRLEDFDLRELYQAEINRLQGELNIVQEELATLEDSDNNERIAELTNQQNQLNNSISSIQSQFDLMNQVETEYGQILNELELNQDTLAQLQAELDNLIAQLPGSGADSEQPPSNQGTQDQDLLDQITEIEGQIAQLVEAIRMLEEAQAELDAQSQNLETGWNEYYAGLAQLQAAQEVLNSGWAELNSQEAAGQVELDAALTQLTEAESELDQGILDYNQGVLDAVNGRRELNRGFLTYASGLEELMDGQAEFVSGKRQALEGELLFNQGLQDFQEEVPGAIADLRSGQFGLYQGGVALDSMSEPVYYVSPRKNISSYVSIDSNAQQLNVISNIFPVFFILIAILVTYTTIRRMVSEQRNYMGTMKQLGYPNSAILTKFILYAGLAGVLGTVLGLVIGYLLFPRVVVGAYGIMYYFDDMQLEISWFWNAVSAAVAMATVLVPAITTPLLILRSPAGQLLIPEPPKSGKKTLLERVGFIWNRIGFYHKLTIRNLLRYKGRNSMTLIGVAGCTMLMLTGFGVSDTINGLADTQFSDIQRFDALAVLQEDLSAKEVEDYIADIAEFEGISGILETSQMTIDVEAPDGSVISTTLTVPMGEPEHIANFIQIRERGGQPLDLNKSGPMITERLAELLDYNGEAVVFRDDDFQTHRIESARISENYAQHYLYMSAQDYEAIIGEEPIINTLLLNYDNDASRSELDRQINDLGGVLSLVDIEVMAGNVRDAMGSLDLITLVLILAAAALSFIVLYNLTNINVSERLRELSTIKVLGFYDREVSMYIFNEVLVLTFIGSVLGLGMGYVLTHYIMKTMQTNELLFYPVVNPTSYLYSLILSFVFSAIVMFAMHRKMKGIDMVEALKAVE